MTDDATMTIRERAEAEAQRAEAEPDDDGDEAAEDDETPAPGEPEPEPEPQAEPAPEPPTQAQLEKMMDKLAKEDERHAKRYAEVLGEQFEQMEPCPRCLQSGHIYPPEIAPVDLEQTAAVDASLGRLVEPELEQAKDAERCADCDGWGMVLTGAQNEQGRTKPCAACGGMGWTSKTAPGPPDLRIHIGTAPDNGEPANPNAEPMRDAWGRAAGHPHWGIDPATIGV